MAEKYTPQYTLGVMHELGDEFNKFYYSHPRMETTPSLSIIPRHLQFAVMNALQKHWDEQKEKTIVNPPEIVGTTHVAVDHRGAEKYIHPHEVAQHKLEGFHVVPLDSPVPKTTITSGLKSPEQIRVLYAGPTWIHKKFGGFWNMSHFNDLHNYMGRPTTLKEPAIRRPTDEDMKLVTHEWDVNGKKVHEEPFSILTSTPYDGRLGGWWTFGADHRTGDVSVWAN